MSESGYVVLQLATNNKTFDVNSALFSRHFLAQKGRNAQHATQGSVPTEATMFTRQQGVPRRRLRRTRLSKFAWMGTGANPKSRGVGGSIQGEGVGGIIPSNMGPGERSKFTNSAKACLPCCQQVRRTLARI